MKLERDWLDYTQLASEVAQNFQLAGIHGHLEQLRSGQGEANQALSVIAKEERRRAAHAEIQKYIRNGIWKLTQLLEDAKKNCTDEPLHLALRLHLCTPPISPDVCDDWEDKQRLQSFSGELAKLKSDVKAKLGEAKYEDTIKCSKSVGVLRKLDRYILMSRAVKEHFKVGDPLKKELEELKRQRDVVRFNLFKPCSWTPPKELDARIAQKESEVSAHCGKRIFESVFPETNDREQMRQRFSEIGHESNAVGPPNEHHVELTRGQREHALLDEFLELSKEFGDHDKAVQYRTELLESVKRCFELQSLEEAEALVTGRTTAAPGA